jgi:hypothetical protein
MKLKVIRLLLISMAMLLLLVACGGSAASPLPTYTPYPRYTPYPVPTPEVVIKEVVVEKIVEKEVVVVKIVEVVVTATPTPLPIPTTPNMGHDPMDGSYLWESLTNHQRAFLCHAHNVLGPSACRASVDDGTYYVAVQLPYGIPKTTLRRERATG